MKAGSNLIHQIIGEPAEVIDVSSTYLFGWDHDTNLLNSFGKFIGFNSAVTIQVEILERLLEDLFFGCDAR